MTSRLLNLKQGGRGSLRPISEVVSADGPINIKNGVVYITKGSAAVITLAAPISGVDDESTLSIIALTAFAHKVTNSSPGFNNLGASADDANFGGAVGDSLTLRARGGVWYTEGAPRNVTFA